MTNDRLIPLAALSSQNGGPIEASLPHLYKLARTGEIPVIRLGRKVLVSTRWVENLLAEK
jgi:excisionase family DNA binding protein